jgi:photosynthesis system II assembly factor YCF48-like protein
VKHPESNPLRTELARSQQCGAHPDSDELTAFTEGALLARERERVLAHLALCVQCREVLGIATAAAPETVAETQPLPRPVRPPLRSWLPWVAAAAVLVVSSTMLLHEQQKPGGKVPSVESTQMAKTEPTRVPATPPPPSEAKTEPHKVTGSLARRETAPLHAKKSIDAAVGKAMVPPVPLQEQRAQAISPQAEVANSNDHAVNGGMVSSAKPTESAESPAAGLASSLKPSQENSEPIARVQAAPSESEAVEGRGESATRSRVAFSGAASVPMMRKAIPSSDARPHWRINDSGQLERSLEDGAWQVVPMSDTSKLHVVSVSGSEVWAGGENLRLDHSIDNGATWEPVKLPAKNGYNHTLTHIRFHTAQQGTIDSDDGASWRTSDGGRTWK